MKVMIVEDEMLLALELEGGIEAAGHETAGIALSSAEALQQVDALDPDFAFVDLQLQDGPTGIDVGQYLAKKGVPYIFVTGNVKRIPEDFAGAVGVIEKPYTMNGLRAVLDFVGSVLDGEEDALPPPSLITPPVTTPSGTRR